MVCDLFYAAWIVIDELHAAGGDDTLTYTQIIDPMNNKIWPALTPSHTAITGSALANGISTTMVFASKALRRHTWSMSRDPVLMKLTQIDMKDMTKVWKKFEKTANTKTTPGETPFSKLQSNKPMANLLETFATILGMYFIARDYESVDPWGKTLDLLNGTLKKQYLLVKYPPDQHAKLLDVERNIQAQVKYAYEQLLSDWEDPAGNDGQGPKPKKPAASKVDPTSYQKAKVIAAFPNIMDAIYKWQDNNLDKPLIIGDETNWGDSLGTNNLALDLILKTTASIEDSFIWQAVDDICEGSAKMAHCIASATATYNELTDIKHPQHPNKRLQHHSKYVWVSNVRLVKAVAYAVSVLPVCNFILCARVLTTV